MTSGTRELKTSASLDDVARFGRIMLESRDIDPVYPVLRSVLGLRNMKADGSEEGLWLTILYVAFYHLPSALEAHRRIGWPVTDGRLRDVQLADLPIGIERRGLRGGKVVRHLQDMLWHLRRRGSIRGFLQQQWEDADPPHRRYLRFWESWQQVWGNGRWSAFKMAEILQDVHDYSMCAPDMRLADCSGPREGLIWLYGITAPDSRRVEVLNGYGLHLRRQLADRGVPTTWEQLETILCNFNSMRQGRYYPGHDIDEMQEQIVHAHQLGRLGTHDTNMLWLARRLALPEAYRGEDVGWVGVQRHLMRTYQQTGEIVSRP